MQICKCLFIFFCFRMRNNIWALEQAKANVIKRYPVVGVLDLLQESVNAFEKAFPQFFEGASIVYNKTLSKF